MQVIKTLLNFIEQIKLFGLEKFGRFYSIYPGEVVSNSDPKQQGRIKVKVPSIGINTELTNYAYPISPYAGNGFGLFFPPEEGEKIWIMFESGNTRFPLYIGGWWLNPNKNDSEGQIPADMKQTPPTVRGIVTKTGHKLLFDESANNPGITIQSKEGHSIKIKDVSGDRGIEVETFAGHKIDINDEGNVGMLMQTASGHTIDMKDYSGDKGIEIISSYGHKIDLNDEGTKGINVETYAGHKVNMDDDGNNIDIIGAGDGVRIRLNATDNKVELWAAGATQPFVRGLDLFAFLVSHTHPESHKGTTGPPAPGPSNSMLSEKIFGE